jgi:hypothetical protein
MTPRHDPERHAALYVSGELPRRVLRWFEQHLLECEDCWREVWLGRLGRRVAAYGREAATPRLRERVVASVELAAGAGGMP